MTHNNEYCPKYKDKVLPNEKGNCSLCNEKLTEETIMTDKKDLKSWLERLDTLQKCNGEGENCTHYRTEEGEIQPFDYAIIDMCLDQIISEIKDYLK